MKKLTILAGAATLTVVAGAALAQTAAPRADRNADVTRQQVIERVDAHFSRLDLNNDGRVTPEEMRQAHEQRRGERAARMFDRLDLDGDGTITRAEFEQARSQMHAQRGERRFEGRRGGMRGKHHMRGGHERMFGEQGFVTREQMRERALARFDRLDLNGDGTVTAAERQQAREQMRQRMRERRSQGS